MHDPQSPAPMSIGPFRITRRLGAGGMAETFEGVREGPAGFVQRVCIKRVLPALAEDRELRRLFLREARLAASLHHRNVTQVVELGEHEGVYYLALELVDGMDLRSVLRGLPGRQLPLQLAMLVGLEVAEALAHAHAHQVVHRDVSPQNILVSLDGEVKLTDFGISKALDDLHVTRSDVVRGNIWYMAPELLEHGVLATPRSDLFSLGLVLFECLSGTRPYPAGTHSSGTVASLREVAPNLPEPVLMLVERLTSFRPEDRFASARAVVDTLAPLTREAACRRALGTLLREQRERPVRVEETAATDSDPGRPPPREPVAPVRRRLRERWKKYAVAPGVWASATRAALLRRSGRHTAAPQRAEASSADTQSLVVWRAAREATSERPDERESTPDALPPNWSPILVAAVALALISTIGVCALALVVSVVLMS